MKHIHMIASAVAIAAVSAGASIVWQQTRAPINTPMANSSSTKPIAPSGVVQDDSGKAVAYWYDPMVPTQKFDKPGKSPFMDMQLQPKYAEADNQDAGVAIPAQTQQNLGIRLAKAEMKSFEANLSAVGRIQADERRFYVVQTRIPGFVERLLIRAMGDPVAKGQKVAEMYAPELLAAQQEYLALIDYERGTNNNTTNDLAQAARSRLKLLGMSEGEIAAITKSGKPSPRFGIYAPASGITSELNVREGGQLMPGNSLMQITDLSNVWLMADVPEQDAARLKIGTAAEVHLQSLPSETFKGKVDYLYPALDATTRSLQVRIELANKGGRLRPSMYANVIFTGEAHEALSVPTEAVIATGTRKMVIVKLKNGFHPMDITTGQEVDNRTEILQGLSEGDEVVASGQFLIDSEASLSGVLSKLSQNATTLDNMSNMDMKEPPKQDAMKIPEKMPVGNGKVVEVDAKSGKVTLAHEPIPDLGWPSMTMDFQVKDAKQLMKIKAGDTVEFDLKADPKTEQYGIEHINKQTDEHMGAKP